MAQMTEQEQREMEEEMIRHYEESEFGRYCLISDALDHSIGGNF